jgi:hypothetical protein
MSSLNVFGSGIKNLKTLKKPLCIVRWIFFHLEVKKGGDTYPLDPVDRVIPDLWTLSTGFSGLYISGGLLSARDYINFIVKITGSTDQE